MALGDLTISESWHDHPHFVVRGQAEVSSTRTAFAIGGTGTYVIPGTMVITSPDDALVCEVDYNENASGTGTNGSVALASNLVGVNTIDFTVKMLL